MLEYIHHAQLSADDVFMLVQATSPLTETIHFTEALEMYGKGEYDSILTCVRNYRFFSECGRHKHELQLQKPSPSAEL